MSNKSDGREIANLPHPAYVEIMGGEVNTKDTPKKTGINFSNFAVQKYYNILSNYYFNRFRWHSDFLDAQELRLIEYYLFHQGKCALLYPTISKNGVRLKSKKLKIYPFTALDVNMRNLKPQSINILNAYNKHLALLDVTYYPHEFVVFSDNFIDHLNNIPFSYITWEYANKLYEIDLAFNSNAMRLRMPFVFNNGAAEISKNGVLNTHTNKGISLSELMRSAFGRNEQFVEVPQNMVGAQGFMFEPQYVNNDLTDHLDAQDRVYKNYMKLLGLYTQVDKQGVYTVKSQQEHGDETGDFISNVYLNNREFCAEEARKLFNINLRIEVI